MARRLTVYGNEEYLVRLAYEKSKDDRTEVVKEFHYDYYEEANEKYMELRNLWENGELGWNASAKVVKVTTMFEVFNYFG
jgi:hypothetical protein